MTAIPPIFTIPSEVAEHTLTYCHPRDVAAFSQACRRAHTLVYKSTDHYLWRTLFLSYPFDDLRAALEAPADSACDWRGELQRRVHAETLACDGGDRHELFDVLLSVLQSAPPLRAGQEPTPSASLQWLLRVAQDSQIFTLEPIFTELDKVAQLRAHFALTLEPGQGPGASDRLKVLRRSSRTYVYDLRNYDEARGWGPFCEGAQRVDWMHVSAIVTTITMNLRDFGSHWPREFQPQAPHIGLEASRAYSAPDTLNHPANDWAGITGHWMRVVSFVDYRDLIRFNAYGCLPSFFDDEYEEASRLLRMKLHVVSVEDDPKVLATLPDPARPPITLGGTMRGFNTEEQLDRAVHGTVAVMPDGNIRWSFVSLYDNREQWSSEGVQLGGVCSAAGVVGTWTGAFHEHGDPAGPFWLFKTSEKTPKEAWPE